MIETRLVPLRKIKDNPWRDRVRNPIDAERVEAIATSISKTSKYWLGTYGREVKGGFIELAFGHHRYEAAKAQGLKEIPITIEPFTDGEMLVWMAQENVRGELPVVIEAVSAAVKALGEGKIEVEAPAPKTKTSSIRYAPSFIAGAGSSLTVRDHPYTASTIARYLGYVDKTEQEARSSVVAAMGILERAEIASLEGGKDEKAGIEKAIRVEKSFSKMKVNDALKVLSEVKGREAKIKERTEKSAEEIRKADETRRVALRLIKEREAKERKEHDELLRKQAQAKIAENAAEAERIKQQLVAKLNAAEAKAEVDKAKLKALDENLAAKKEAAQEQRKVDEYLPHRKEADRIIHILERRDLEEDIKALARRSLNAQDRERVRKAAMTLGTWYTEWVATRFLPPTTPRKRITKESVNENGRELLAQQEHWENPLGTSVAFLSFRTTTSTWNWTWNWTRSVRYCGTKRWVAATSQTQRRFCGEKFCVLTVSFGARQQRR